MVRKLVFLFLVSGCASSSEIYLADGQKALSIRCSPPLTRAACYEKAGTICGDKGYDELSEQGTVVAGSQRSAYSDKNMLIRCKR